MTLRVISKNRGISIGPWHSGGFGCDVAGGGIETRAVGAIDVFMPGEVKRREWRK